MSARRCLLAAFLFTLILTSPLVAQHPNVARGVGINQAFDIASGLETIDTFNGGLSLRIPISQSYPVGGGFSYGLTLSYSSKLWDYEPVEIGGQDVPHTEPSESWNAGFGWRLSLGQLYGPDDMDNPTEGYWVYVAPDGGQTVLYNSLRSADRPTGTWNWWIRERRGLAKDLIRGGLKRSKSYRGELAEKTYEEIVTLSKGKGVAAAAAKQMKKLIEQSPRLGPKTKASPRP